MRSERGVTLVEATIILAVMAILTSVLAPSAMSFVDQARQSRARTDVQVIGDAINDFIADTGEMFFVRDGRGLPALVPPSHADGNRVDLLVSDGDIPRLASAISGESFWQAPLGFSANLAVDTLSNHLIENLPNEDGTFASSYRTPSNMTIAANGGQSDFARIDSSGFNGSYAWRGPYLRGPVEPDPWGNRYMVNVGFLKTSTTTTITGITAGFGVADYPRLDTFVLSAGPDEEVDTRSAQDGAVPFDDDFIYIVAPNAR